MDDRRIMKTLREEAGSDHILRIFQGSIPTGDPRHYKYYWDVAVLSDDRSRLVWFRNLSASVWAMWERTFIRRRCEDRREPYYVRNRRVPRWSDAPLQPNSGKFGGEWALPYRDDPDSETEDGQK